MTRISPRGTRAPRYGLHASLLRRVIVVLLFPLTQTPRCARERNITRIMSRAVPARRPLKHRRARQNINGGHL